MVMCKINKTTKSLSISFVQLFRYSFRSFLRNYKKNIVLMVTVAAGLLSYIFINSLLVGIKEQSIKNIIKFETGSIQLMHQKYYESILYPIDDTISFPPSLQNSLSQEGWKSSPQLRFNTDIVMQSPPFRTDGTLHFSVLAIDLARDEFMFDELLPYITSTINKDNKFRTNLQQELDQDGVIMGKWLANRLEAKVGYPITLITKGKGGFFEQIELEIVGIIDSPDSRLNREYLIMSYACANDYLLADEYTTVNLIQQFNVPNDTKLQQDFLTIQKILNQSQTIHPNTSNTQAYLWKPIQTKRYNTISWDYSSGIAFIYMVFIFIIAAAGISNNVAMNIVSRKKEIGTMQAFGMTTKQLIILYTLEMFFVGVIASIIACVAGIGLMSFLVNTGLDYTAMLKESTFGIPTSGILYGSWVFQSLLTASIIGICFTLTIGLLVMIRLKQQYTNTIEMLRAHT